MLIPCYKVNILNTFRVLIILRQLLLLTNLHLKLLSTQGTGADKLLSTQRVNTYRDVLMQVPARSLRQNLIHPPFVKRVYSECSPLIQLIALINNLKADKNDTNLVIIESKSHSFCRFAFSVSRLYLNSQSCM